MTVQVAFYSSVVICAIYFIAKPRRFDFLAVFFFSAIIYSSPILIGGIELERSYGHFVLTPKPITYIYLSIFFVCVGMATAAHDAISQSKPSLTNCSDRLRAIYALHARIAIGFAIAMLIVTLMGHPEILYGTKKVDWIRKLSRPFTLYSIFSIYAILLSLLARRVRLLVTSIAVGLVSVYIGFRLVPVIALICCVTALEVTRGWRIQPLWRRWKLWGGGIAAMVSALVIKRIYIHIKRGEFEKISESIPELTSIADAVSRTEPALTSLVHLSAVENSTSVGMGYVGTQLLGGLVPFGSYFGLTPEKTFSTIVQGEILGLSDLGIGLAQSNWGEWYLIGGIVGVASFTIIWLGVIIVTQRLMLRMPMLFPMFTVFLAFITFYQFRNGLLQVANFSKRVVLTGLVILAVALIIRGIWRAIAFNNRTADSVTR